jgi:hypothetical protein
MVALPYFARVFFPPLCPIFFKYSRSTGFIAFIINLAAWFPSSVFYFFPSGGGVGNSKRKPKTTHRRRKRCKESFKLSLLFSINVKIFSFFFRRPQKVKPLILRDLSELAKKLRQKSVYIVEGDFSRPLRSGKDDTKFNLTPAKVSLIPPPQRVPYQTGVAYTATPFLLLLLNLRLNVRIPSPSRR